MINNKFFHFETYREFLKFKVSADLGNTTYTIGGIGEVYQGEPDIPYQSIVYVKDKGFSITHGAIYDSSGFANALKESVLINGTDFTGGEDIITKTWGETRKISISDYTGTNIGRGVLVNGGNDIILYLPKDLDINASNDYLGNNIAETYTTKSELTQVIDDLPSFNVYSGDDDQNPTLYSKPALDWTTQSLREQHAGDYYVTTTGRIFHFVEEVTGWEWKEITDRYLYDCLETLTKLEDKVDLSEKWEKPQTEPESGTFYVQGIATSGYYLDILCCTQAVNYQLSQDTTLYLPYISGRVWTRTRTNYLTRNSHLITTDELSKAVGKTIILGNIEDSAGILRVELGDGSKELSPGESCILTLRATINDENKLCYTWVSQVCIPSFVWT